MKNVIDLSAGEIQQLFKLFCGVVRDYPFEIDRQNNQFVEWVSKDKKFSARCNKKDNSINFYQRVNVNSTTRWSKMSPAGRDCRNRFTEKLSELLN